MSDRERQHNIETGVFVLGMVYAAVLLSLIVWIA